MREADRELEKIKEDVTDLEAESGVNQCLQWQLKKHIDDLLSELADVCRGILLLDRSSEELLEQGSSLKKAYYAVDLKMKRLLHEHMMCPKLSWVHHASTRVYLQKSSIPTFNGNIMYWRSFWEQLEVSIHKKAKSWGCWEACLPEGCFEGWISAKLVIQGLCQTGGNYAEAIKCLWELYNWPDSFTRPMFVPFFKVLP